MGPGFQNKNPVMGHLQLPLCDGIGALGILVSPSQLPYFDLDFPHVLFLLRKSLFPLAEFFRVCRFQFIRTSFRAVFSASQPLYEHPLRHTPYLTCDLSHLVGETSFFAVFQLLCVVFRLSVFPAVSD